MQLFWSSEAKEIRRDLEFAREFLIRRQNRICFGTDSLQPGQHLSQRELFEKLNDLPQTVHDRIFRRNAERVQILNA